MTGLYVHVPFCKKKCHYCDFVVAAAIKASAASVAHGAFLLALEKQISHHRARFNAVKFETLYLGGGTPSMLSGREMEEMLGLIRRNLRFSAGVEVSCEANPDDVDLDKARLWKSLGIQRVSLGAQSFHDRTLKNLNRAHDVKAILNSFAVLRQAGFKNINLDLILSLPEESPEEALDSVRQAVELGPEHISLYELVVEEKTVFGARHKKGTLKLPGEDGQYEILSRSREYLKKNGYGHYELLNYARPGFESRHNRLYWANADYLGLGPGAWSYFDGRRFRHSGSYDEYLDKARKGDWSALEEETLSEDQKETESFLLALRLTEGADARRFAPVMKRFENEIGRLSGDGLLERGQDRLRLSERGQFLAETVFEQLSSC